MTVNKDRVAYCLFFLFALLFIFIALKGLITLQPGDENVYYYMGKLIAEGKVPYRDFFYAHPPLQIYLISLIYQIFGFNITALKLIPLVSTLASAFFVFKIAKEKFGNIEAIISALLFLFSYSVMFNSVFSFGIGIATMLLIIGVYFLVKNNCILSGMFFGLAGITRLLTLVPIIILFISVLLANRKNFVKLSSTFLIILLLVNGFFALAFWDDYSTPVYKFHLLKGLGGKENLKEYTDTIKLNWILFVSALSFVFIQDKKPLNIFIIASVSYLIFLAMLSKIFGFYFIIIFPFLAVIGSYSLIRIIQNLNLVKRWVILISIVLMSIFIWNLAADILFLEKIGFKGFERGKDLTDFIVANTNQSTELFGDDSVVPLLALLTNKKIALNYVDTNNQVFISGIKNINNVLFDLKEKDVLFIIRSKQGISYFNEVRDFLSKNCEFLSQFNDKIEGSYIVYRCK